MNKVLTDNRKNAGRTKEEERNENKLKKKTPQFTSNTANKIIKKNEHIKSNPLKETKKQLYTRNKYISIK